jgi:hemerythrin-like domain-containing protein
MSRAIETLMHEHRVIEQVLGGLEQLARSAADREPVERSTVRDFAQFFSGFADRCHHGKEEERLFVAMVDAGFPREQGPIGVMRYEHEEGRAHVRALRAIGDGEGALSAAEIQAFVAHASTYVDLLRAHIMKEDTILFPMAERSLPQATLEQVGRDFDLFEREVMGEGEHERLHALADRSADENRGRSQEGGGRCRPSV